MRGERGTIAAIANADIGAGVAGSPPGHTAAHPRRPAPAKVVVVVPGAALEGHIAPGVARYPDIAKPRRPHPVAAAVGVESRARRGIRRPDISLPLHVVPAPVRVQVAPGRVAAVGIVIRRPGVRRGLARQHLVAVGVPGVPRIRFDRFNQVVAGGIGAAQGHALAAMQVRRQGRAPLQAGIARKDGQLARRVVQVDAQHRKAARRHHAAGKSNGDRPGLPSALDLEVAQAAGQGNLRLAGRALPAQDRKGHGAVGRKPRHASVFELNFGPAIVRCSHSGSFKQRRIGDGLISKRLAALRKPHLAVHAAQPNRARRLPRIAGPRRGQQSRAHGKRCQPQQARTEPARNQPNAILKAIHGVTPLHGPRNEMQSALPGRPTLIGHVQTPKVLPKSRLQRIYCSPFSGPFSLFPTPYSLLPALRPLLFPAEPGPAS